MPWDLIEDKSTLVQVTACCSRQQAIYLSQCWPRSMSPYGITGPHEWTEYQKRNCGSKYEDVNIFWEDQWLYKYPQSWFFYLFISQCVQTGMAMWVVIHNSAEPNSHSQTNSSPPGAAYNCQWTGSSLVQVMACFLLGTKPLSEPLLAYFQLNSWEHIFSEIWIWILKFSFKKMLLKMLSAKLAAILSRGEMS